MLFNAFGTLTPPAGVAAYNTEAGDQIGILLFISSIIRLVTAVAGIWVLFNIILAGYIYISGSGDSGSHQKVREKITMSVLGLLVIAFAYTATGLLGFLLFGNAAYFLNPTLETVTLPGGGS